MNPVFVISSPRSKGTLLAGIMGVGPVLDAGLLLPDDDARVALAGGGWSNRIGKDGWTSCVNACSRLLRLFPDATLLMLSRDPQETEVSIELTGPLWVPEFGRCAFRAFKKGQEMQDWHRDFAKLNPDRCMLIDAADLTDALALVAKLGEQMLDLPRWEAAVASNETAWRKMRVARSQSGHVGERPMIMGENGRPKRDWSKIPRGQLPFTETFQVIPRQREVLPDVADVFRLPMPAVRLWPVLEVHTIRFGAPRWMPVFTPTQDAWCERHGFKLHVWGDNPTYPSAKFCEVDMLRQFLAGKNEWLLYLDADVYVHPAAPVPDFMDQPGFHIMADRPLSDVSGVWPRWVKQHFGAVSLEGWTYSNAGVWACDREAAAQLLEVIEKPYIKGQQEQHHWNYWLMLAKRAGMRVNDLSPDWNHFPEKKTAGWFFHLTPGNKLRHLDRFRAAGVLPAPPEPLPEMPKGDLPLAIVIPWVPTRWGEDLKYALRSIRKHVVGQLPPIRILSDEPPGWLKPGQGVHWIKATGYSDALLAGLHAAAEVVWWNDDIMLLKDLELEQLRIPIRYEDLWPKVRDLISAGTNWRKHLGRCIRDLHHHGIDSTWNFSTHTPYFYKREEALETLRIFGHRYKIPFETLHFNRVGGRSRNGGGLRTSRLPGGERARYLNYQGEPSEELQGQIAALFPEPAPWERL